MSEAEDFLIKKGIYDKKVTTDNCGDILIADLLDEYKNEKPKQKRGFWNDLKKGLRLQG